MEGFFFNFQRDVSSKYKADKVPLIIIPTKVKLVYIFLLVHTDFFIMQIPTLLGINLLMLNITYILLKYGQNLIV